MSNNDFVSAIERNLAGIREQRNRLKLISEAISQGAHSNPQPAVLAVQPAQQAEQALSRGRNRITQRAMGMFEQVADSVASDFSNVVQRTASLHSFAAGLGSPPKASVPRRKPDAVDVDVVEVEPDPPRRP